MATNFDAQLKFRIPNLPSGPIVDKDGNPTQAELNFRQMLLQQLQLLMGNEGLVMPMQSSSNITTIQDNSNLVPGTNITTYPCQFGTMIYNETDKSVMVAIDDGTGVPVFKTVTLS
jgi:hypothetical protein